MSTPCAEAGDTAAWRVNLSHDLVVGDVGDHTAGSCWCRRRRPRCARSESARTWERLTWWGKGPAVEPGQDVVDGDVGHLLASRPGRRADVRHDDQVRRLPERIVGNGSGSGSVTSSAAPPIWPVWSASASACFVDDRSAGGVDQNRGRLHQRRLRCTDQVPRARSVSGQVDRDEIRAAAADARGCCCSAGFGRQLDLHAGESPSRSRAPGHRLADAAKADDPERRAVVTSSARGSPLGSHVRQVPLRTEADGLRQMRRAAAISRCERQVGGRLGERVGGVADRDAPRRVAASTSMLS